MVLYFWLRILIVFEIFKNFIKNLNMKIFKDIIREYKIICDSFVDFFLYLRDYGKRLRLFKSLKSVV